MTRTVDFNRHGRLACRRCMLTVIDNRLGDQVIDSTLLLLPVRSTDCFSRFVRSNRDQIDGFEMDDIFLLFCHRFKPHSRDPTTSLQG